jgi:hypothetical protein
MPAPCNACPACLVGRNYRTGVEFPDSSRTPLACPGATTREHDPVWEKTTASVPLNPILADQVWAREIQQGGPIPLRPASWNLYPACNVDKNGHIETESFNLLKPDGTIPLGPAPWNEICPKKYLSLGIPVVQLWHTTCNKSFSIPLGCYCSKKKSFQKAPPTQCSWSFFMTI